MFANTLTLCRLIDRRDRLRNLIWTLCLMLLVIIIALLLPNMYPTELERTILAETLKNPAMLTMMGPAFDENGFTVGVLYSTFMLLWSAVIIAVMNIFLVVRHTRQDEESGRIEVVRSLPVGRLSNLSAVLLTALALNTVITIVLAASLAALKIDSMDLTGCLNFAASMGATGLMFAAVTAVFCQLSASPRTAQALAFTYLIVAYMVRALGDMQNETLAKLSPLGLVLRTKPFGENDWVPILLLVVQAAGFSVLAFYLCSKRDMGEGLLPARRGRRDANALLSSAPGLAWRLLGTPFIIWFLVIPVLSMCYGSIMGDLEAFISTNEVFLMMFPDGDPAQFVSYLMVVMSIISTIPIVQFVLKARSQESGGFAENVLARSVSRHAQLSGYFAIALIAAVLMPLMNAVGFWIGSTPVMDDPIPFSTYFESAMSYVPALMFMLGIAMLLIGYMPRRAGFIWAYLGYAFFALYLGSMLDLPEWILNLSPYNYIPKLPVDEFDPLKFTLMIAISVAMYAVGFIGHRRRDMSLS